MYQTGLKRSLFKNARLVGSWDAAGRPSPHWSELLMTEAVTADGCPAFAATVDLETDDGGTLFAWGVRLDGPQGQNLWGILTEVNALHSNDRSLEFRLDPAASDPTEQVYRLSLSRFLGANKLYRANGTTAIQFRVWAPNARAMETVIGHTWRRGDAAQRQIGRAHV